MKNFISIIVIISFFCSCSNFIPPLPALASLFGILLLPLTVKYNKKVPRFLFILYLFFLVSIISVLFYDPFALINYFFYRYDGNFIVSYAPLFLIPVVSKDLDVKKLLKKFIYFETVVNAIVLIVTITLNNFHLSAEESFGSLFYARNAAGGFFSFCITITFLFFWEVRNSRNFFLMAINIFFLLATYSRGSMLGVGFCIILYWLFEKNMGKIAIVAIIITLIFEVFLVSKTFDIYKKASSQYNGYDYVLESMDADQSGKSANITIRLLFAWPSGIDEFIHSPILGAGFGSVNDKPYIFDNNIGLINPNKQPDKQYNDAHAHNTYFHISGEQGILGIGIFVSFLISLYMFFNKNTLVNDKYPFVKNVVLLYILNISFMSLTEHRLTTPSNVLPFTLLIVLFFADYNYRNYLDQQSNKSS